MFNLIKKLFGTPTEHEEEKKDHEVVETPEFDITQYAKKLGVGIGILVGALIAALKAAGVEEVTEPVVLVGALGVVAAALLGMSFVMAVDLASRAYLTGEGAAEKKGKKAKKDGDKGSNGDGDAPDGKLIPAPARMMVWLQGETDPRPVLAMAGDGEKVSSYLVAEGATVNRTSGMKSVQALDGTPKWRSADEVRAVRTAKWP